MREEARRRLAIEKAADAPTFEAVLLADVPLYCPEDDFRITGLMPSNASTVLNAQHKAGKTTLALNLAHSLLLGEKFLGEFRVNPISGGVAHLNYEVPGEQLGYWARQAGLPGDRFLQINLRGKRNPFAHPEDLERLAEKLRAYEVESLIVDPFGQAYPRTNQDSSGEVGAWLAELNMFAREQAGVCDLILVVHAGWNQERFHTGQVGAQAEVGTFAERDVVIRVAGDVEVVRSIEYIGVAVGRGQQGNDHRAARDDHTVPRHVLVGVVGFRERAVIR